MLGAAIIVFREVIEAGLIAGIILAATEGVAGRTAYVIGGIAAGVLGASILAIFAGSLSSALAGMGQEVFNASILGIAVIREGAEVVLFLYGLVVANGESNWSLLAGGVLGLGAGVALSALTYTGLVIIPSRYLFSVTSFLIAFLAAGMASQCVRFLDQADILTSLNSTLWDTSSILPADSFAGRILHTLAGYDDRPSIMQAIV